jgi:hypothetical protein
MRNSIMIGVRHLERLLDQLDDFGVVRARIE